MFRDGCYGGALASEWPVLGKVLPNEQEKSDSC